MPPLGATESGKLKSRLTPCGTPSCCLRGQPTAYPYPTVCPSPHHIIATTPTTTTPLRYLDARGDAALQRLRQLAYSPAAWFRCPLVQLVLVSCGEYEDYKRDLRIRLRAMADTETSAPGQPELLFAYVRPTTVEAGAKGPARVFDAMRRDLNRRRERCVRLDPTSVTATEAGHAGVCGRVSVWSACVHAAH